MKHLKSFNESLTDERIPDNIRQDLQDICQELQDEGFGILFREEDHGTNEPHIRYFGYDLTTKYDITTTTSLTIFFKGWKEFNLKDISETLERIKDYLHQNGYQCKMDYGISGDLIPSKKPQPVINSVYMVISKKKLNESIKIEPTILPKDEILIDLHDMCLELSDIGYDIIVSKTITKDDQDRRCVNCEVYLIHIIKSVKHTEPDLQETLLRMTNYMSRRRFRREIVSKYSGTFIFFRRKIGK